MLFLPDGFKKAGIIPAGVMLTGSGILATYCMMLLLDTKRQLKQDRGIVVSSVSLTLPGHDIHPLLHRPKAMVK